MSKREMTKREKKKLLRIRKAVNILEDIALFISFLGVLGLVTVIALAPEIIECGGNYYIGLLVCLVAILLSPALAWLEDLIVNPTPTEKEE